MGTPKQKLSKLEEKMLELSSKLNTYVQGNGSSEKLKKRCALTVKKIHKIATTATVNLEE